MVQAVPLAFPFSDPNDKEHFDDIDLIEVSGNMESGNAYIRNSDGSNAQSAVEQA